MATLIRWPAWLYQRYQQHVQHALLAGGWALLYTLCDLGVDAFAMQWRVVLALAIFIGGLFKPVIAYALFIAAIAYPLYLISIYIMALALAVLILSAPYVAGLTGTRHVLPQALSLLAAPLLAAAHLTPLLPLLAGLWWGETAGAVVGGLGALWLKLLAGMSGQSLDLWPINGWALSAGPLLERFHDANSLATLQQLVAPFAADSLALLFHLLQILAWAAAGWCVGWLSNRRRPLDAQSVLSRPRPAARTLLSLGPSLLLLWVGYVAVPIWLEMGTIQSWLTPWPALQLVLCALVVFLIHSVRRYFEQPVLAHSSRPRRASAPFRPATTKSVGRVRPVPQAQGSPSAPKKPDQDIIMLELD